MLLLPGLVALGYALYNGPASWAVDGNTFWGTPISLFVFWIGLAHAGTLLSAIFLVLDIKQDKRTAMLAELSTLCSLAVAVIFPLMHLGVLDRFYMVIPLADARMNFANIRSPLVWDFCCIVIYGILSLLFFGTHLACGRFPGLSKIRKPLGWLLFPLVLWVHTVVSLDFAATFVPEWQGAFFPVYFIVGAIYSGLALVGCILWFEGYRMRLLEQLVQIGSWLLCAIWLWNFMVSGNFCTSAFIFAGLLPQLLLVSAIKNSRVGRLLIYISILVGLLLERLFLVSPGLGETVHFGLVDLGLLAFGLSAFILGFCGIRWYLGSAIEGESTFFGEVDDSDLVKGETAGSVGGAGADSGSGDGSDGSDGAEKYVEPWRSYETRTLRFPMFVGLSLTVLFCIWCGAQLAYDDVELTLVQVAPIIYPMAALIAALIAVGKAFYKEVLPELNTFSKKRRMIWSAVVIAFCILIAGLMGAFYGGGASVASDARVHSAPVAEISNSPAVELSKSRLIWNSRCASCHGTDGKFNEKFVREFYPVPQKLDSARIDSIGVDSLVQVILQGRANMNAYEGRLTEVEARGLVHYMQKLAQDAQQSAGEAK